MTDLLPDVSRRQMLASGLTAASAMLLTSGCQTAPIAASTRLRTEPEPLKIAGDADVRCGMIGIGGRGSGVLGAIHRAPGVRVTALCDINADNLKRAASMVADDKPALFEDYKKMLECDQLDAVFVETPCYLHAPMVIDVLNSGRHCYGEKPMAITVKDLNRIIGAVEKTRRVFQVGTQLPYASPWAGAIEAVRKGDIGEPILIRAHRHNAGDLPHDIPWFFKRKLCGDTILEQAVHEFDIFNAIFNAIPAHAGGFGGQAMLHEPPGRDIMDHYVLALDYGNNRKVSYSHSWISVRGLPYDGRQELVYGTEGAIDVESGTIYPRQGDPRKVNPEPAGDSTQLAVNAFFECVREGKRPLCDAIRGRNGALVALLGLKAMDTGKVAHMNDLLTWG